MKNPNGPYPGRQLFLGQTVKSEPCFAYLVTGRSPQSRERRAAPAGNTVIMGPLENVPYDPLRHYTALKYDNDSGVLAVSNGIQTEAIYETYKLLRNVQTPADKSFLEKIMEGARSEDDPPLDTPRIGGVVTFDQDGKTVSFVSIKTIAGPASAWRVNPKPGEILGVSTYNGNMENPGAYDVKKGPTELKTDAGSPQEIADFLYGISEATNKGEDIRVCVIGGIRTGGMWKTAVINRHSG